MSFLMLAGVAGTAADGFTSWAFSSRGPSPSSSRRVETTRRIGRFSRMPRRPSPPAHRHRRGGAGGLGAADLGLSARQRRRRRARRVDQLDQIQHVAAEKATGIARLQVASPSGCSPGSAGSSAPASPRPCRHRKSRRCGGPGWRIPGAEHEDLARRGAHDGGGPGGATIASPRSAPRRPAPHRPGSGRAHLDPWRRGGGCPAPAGAPPGRERGGDATAAQRLAEFMRQQPQRGQRQAAPGGGEPVQRGCGSCPNCVGPVTSGDARFSARAVAKWPA